MVNMSPHMALAMLRAIIDKEKNGLEKNCVGVVLRTVNGQDGSKMQPIRLPPVKGVRDLYYYYGSKDLDGTGGDKAKALTSGNAEFTRLDAQNVDPTKFPNTAALAKIHSGTIGFGIVALNSKDFTDARLQRILKNSYTAGHDATSGDQDEMYKQNHP